MSALTKAAYGPSIRVDSAPPHHNPVRRFREELRLRREDFAELLSVSVNAVRVWEDGRGFPRPDASMRLVALAKRNNYPLSQQEIYQYDEQDLQPRKSKKTG